jgi:alkylation response protein AidB-like acyl-CoA dehydrogenase
MSNAALATKTLFDRPPVARVAALADVIANGGDRAQQMRRLPDDTVAKLVDAGFFRFTLPRELGGEDASALQTIEVLEAIAAIDASVAWNVMLGSEINAMAAGGMPRDMAKEVYLDNPRVIMCGGGGPGSTPSRALAQSDGSYLVSGQTTFISGCHNAEWCFMVAPIFDGETLRMTPQGPAVKTWFLHRSQWQILDTWDVAGLRGSGSHDVKADNARVSDRHARVELMTVPALYPNPVYRIPVPLRLAYNKSAVALGVAKGALECFGDLANKKVPMMSVAPLRERPIAQYRMGEATAKYRAARAYMFDTMDAVEEELRRGAEAPSALLTQNARLACTYAANACMEVVDLIHNSAGTSAMRMNNPLERKLRDAHGCATHRWVSHALYTDLGKILLGGEPSAEFGGTGMPMPS